MQQARGALDTQPSKSASVGGQGQANSTQLLISAYSSVAAAQENGASAGEVATWVGQLNYALGMLEKANASTSSTEKQSLIAEARSVSVLVNASAAKEAVSLGEARYYLKVVLYVLVVPVSVALAYLSHFLIERAERRQHSRKEDPSHGGNE